MLALSVTALHAQEVLSGTVTDEATSQGMAGVTVFEKGTTNGTFTDAEGKYDLTVKDGSTTLVFRYVGYKTVEQAGGGDVTMTEDALMLDEVVVTALGIAREKKQLGYSVQSVGGDALVNSGESNLINGLNSKVAGVQVISSSGSPGSSAYINIRGSSSISGNNQPLIVIDGVPLDNSQNTTGNPDDGNNNLLAGVANSNRGIDINPNDIEDITVLKGPAASALYGIQAANGVLLITTKKGRNNQGKGVSVSFNTAMTWDKVNKLPELQDQYSQGLNGNYQGPTTGRAQSWGANLDTLSWNGDPNYLFDNNGDIVSSNDPTAKTAVTPYDNLEQFFRTGVTTDNNLSLSGGNSATTYRFSIGRMNQTGVVPLSEFGRTSVKFAGETKLSARFRTAASIGYTNSGGSRVQQGSNISGLMLGLLRTPRSFDNSNGLEDASDPNAYLFADGRQRNYRGGGGYDNPYWTINQNPFTDQTNRIYGFTSVTYDVTKWLNVFYRVGTDAYSESAQQVFAQRSRNAPAGQIFLQKNNYRHVNSDLWVTLSHDFSEKISTSLLLGQNAYSQEFNRLYTQGDGFAFPNFTHISNAQTILTRDYTERKRTAAAFFDAKVAYDNWAFLNITGRNEWSSTLPVDNRSFFYPSASLGIVFTEPLGMSENKILPYGKLRLSYASVGNDADPYSLAAYYSSGVVGDGWTNGVFFPINGASGFSADDILGSPTLRPEKTSSLEIGADLRFLNNRIGLDFTYYNQTSTDQIFAVPIAASSGVLQLISNAGEISNKGMEIVLNATPVKTKDFRWDMQFNFTRNRNMVVSLAEGIENVFLGGFEGSAVRNVAGQPYGQIYGGTYLRDDAGNLVIESDTNSGFFGYPIFSGIEGAIGNTQPDFLLGIRNTLTWKGLSFGFLIDIRQGGEMWNGTEGVLRTFGMAAVTAGRDDAPTAFEGVKGTTDVDGNLVLQDENGQSGTFTNDIAVPLNQDWYLTDGGGFGNISEQFVQSTSWVRLREMTLSYTLPTSLLEKTPISGLNIGLSGRNLLLFTEYTGIDPETNLMGSVNAQGLDYFNMPNTKSYSIRLGITF